LNIPTFAIVDTNSNPNIVDYPIPANDDASTSIAYIIEVICKAVGEGLADRKMDKDAQAAEEEKEKDSHSEAEELAHSSTKVKDSLLTAEEEGTKGAAKKPGARKRTVIKK